MNLGTLPLIYLITAGAARDETFLADRAAIVKTISLAVDLGVPLVQIREKNLSARNLFSLAAEVASIARGSSTRVLVNDRADIAKAALCDGVHLTSRSLPAAALRKVFGSEFIIGVSTHSREDVGAKRGSTDFAVFSPVFESPGKSQPKGVSQLKLVAAQNEGYPILALGGINSTNYREAIEAGAAGFAAIRALNDPPSLARIVKELKND